MLFLSSCLIFVILSIIIFKKAGIQQPFSKGLTVAIFISLLAVICLAENYTHSLIPEVNDGIGITNQIAYWIIGEDFWSHELFQKTYEQSIYITLALLVLYPVILVTELKITSKDKH